jgi:PAS domain S-box-containing protein
MTSFRFAELAQYVRFSSLDAERLAELRDAAEPHLTAIARRFYERIREHADAHDVFQDDAQIERLQVSLVGWLRRALTGPYDEAYFAHTARVGAVHVRVGLPQRYMTLGMAVLRRELEALADSAPQPAATRVAVSKLLDVELAVMSEAYFEHYLARIDEVNRHAVDAARANGTVAQALALEVARVLVVGLDHDERVVLFNREAERVSGYARDEVLGRPLLELFAADPGSPRRAGVEEALRTADPAASLDEPLITRTGARRLIRWHFARISEPDAPSSFAFGLDVTHHHALEEQVRLTEKLATIGTLAAGLAHEIRNPLNGAMLHLTYLSRTLRGADPELAEAASVVQTELQRLSRLVTEFLSFARPRPLSLRRTTAQDLVRQAAAVVSPQASQAGVRVAVDVPDAPLELEIDAGRVEQVLLNLALNAIEALEPLGQGTLTLRARRRPTVAVFEVHDDGPGVPTGRPPIFDPFYTTKPTGSGLGLAIARRIATDHGGTLDYESQPGSTTFRLTLPLAPPLLPAPPPGPEEARTPRV